MRSIISALVVELAILATTFSRPLGPLRPKYRPVRNPYLLRHVQGGSCTSVFNRTAGLSGRNGMIERRFRWQRFDVQPDRNFEQWELQHIQNAMAVLSNALPCIEFGYWIPGSTPTVRDYVHVVKRTEGGCNSQVGRQGGVQIINLQMPRCFRRDGTVMHEMIHALGIHHEHERPDRDQYITIYWQNIWPAARSAFSVLSPNQVSDFGVPYNTRSIMHYGSYFFGGGKVTMLDKNGQEIPGEESLQQSDVLKLRRMYGCS